MRYKQIADDYIAEIRSGSLETGTRLPSLRRLAQLHDVSITTAMNCYHLLEELGWAASRPQSGFYVTLPLSAATETPQFPQFTSSKTDPSQIGPAGYNASVANPGPLGLSLLGPQALPTEALQRSLRRASQRQGASVHLYPDPQGNLILRQALQQHFSTSHLSLPAEQLVITNGCIDAIRTALEVTTKPGDPVAITSPCFSGLLDLLSGLNRIVVEIPSTSEGIDIDQLEQQMQQGNIRAALFSTSHMNPSGITLSAAQKERLALLANRYQIPMIEDDVYIELGHDNAQPLPAKHWDKEGYILWCGAVSKTLAAGYRVGWCLPGRYLEQYVRLRSIQSYGVSTPVQAALADFIDTGQYLRHLKRTRQFLACNAREYHHFLREQLPEAARISQPEGGMVFWLQIPGLNYAQLQQALQQDNIDIRLGSAFSTLALYNDCLRINFGWPLREDGELSEAGQQLLRLTQLIRQHSPSDFDGTH